MQSDVQEMEELKMKTFSGMSQCSVAFNKGDGLSAASYCQPVTSLFAST